MKLLNYHFEKSYFIRNACKRYTPENERIFSSPDTCDWWLETEVSFDFIQSLFCGYGAKEYINVLQEKLRIEQNSPTAIVLPLIFYSDSTTLSKKGSKSGWPLVMSLGNIPRFHRKKFGGYCLLGLIPSMPGKLDAKDKVETFNKCLELVLGPLKKLSFQGIKHKGFMIFPCLYAYVHDYPEGCKVRHFTLHFYFFPSINI